MIYIIDWIDRADSLVEKAGKHPEAERFNKAK